jgi:RNA polymerase sigma factor (sigma-70 family)
MDAFDVVEAPEAPDVLDSRYEVEPAIAKGAGAPGNNLSYFSREVKDKRYQIREADTQKDWGMRKTDLQRRVGKLLLMTDYGLNSLLSLCEKLAQQRGDKHEFTVIVRNDDGDIKLSHDKSSVIVVRDMLIDFKNGESVMTREQLADVITCHYNLSYHHFTKEHVTHIINESEELGVLLKKWDSCEYNVMKHPAMRKEASRFMTVTKAGRKSAIRVVRESLEKTFSDLNIELETVMTRKEKLDVILKEGELDGDFVLRALKLLNSSLVQYRNRLTETNLRLVMKKAYEHKKKAMAAGLGELDLLSEGTEGMIKAAEMYVSCAGVKFTTYAVRWVELKINRHIKNTNPVRVPIHCKDLMFKICGHLSAKGYRDGDTLPEREVVEEELCTQISKSVWQMAMNHYSNVAMSVSCDNTGSFEDGGMTFDAILGDNSDADNDELGMSVQSAQILRIAKERLSQNEYEVLYRHFMHEQSYQSIHSHLDRHYSSKSISMIKTRAISKLQEAIKEIMPEEFAHMNIILGDANEDANPAVSQNNCDLEGALPC